MDRYARQVIIPTIGRVGQKVLKQSTIAIIGLGGTGTHTAELLTRLGIEKIIIIDRDIVEESNLNRQILYNEKDLGLPKAIQAKKHLNKINSKINITAHSEDINQDNITKIIKKPNIILDCTDNMETRFLINDYSMKNNIPWIYSAAIKEQGSIMNIIPNKTPCFNCIFQNKKTNETCDTVGVLNTITTLISSLQVSETLKILLNNNPEKILLKINLKNNSIDKIKIKKRKNCPTCNKKFEYLNKIDNNIIKFCSSGNYQFYSNKLNLKELVKKLQKIGKVEEYTDFLRFKNMIIFKERTLIKAKSEQEAKSTFSKYIGN